MIIAVWSLACILLGVIIYCLSQRKWLMAIVMAFFLIILLVMGEQYKKRITVANFEILDQHILLTYQDQTKKTISYQDIQDLKHYCDGRSGISGCSVSIYTKDQKIKLPYLKGNGSAQAQELKAQLFAKMNRID